MPEIFSKKDLADELGSGLNPGNILSILLQGQRFMSGIEDREWDEQVKKWRREKEARDDILEDRADIKWDESLKAIERLGITQDREDEVWRHTQRKMADEKYLSSFVEDDREWFEKERAFDWQKGLTDKEREDKKWNDYQTVTSVNQALKTSLDSLTTSLDGTFGTADFTKQVKRARDFINEKRPIFVASGNESGVMALDSFNANLDTSVEHSRAIQGFRAYLTHIDMARLEDVESYTPKGLARRKNKEGFAYENVREAVDEAKEAMLEWQEALGPRWLAPMEAIKDQHFSILDKFLNITKEGDVGGLGTIGPNEAQYLTNQFTGIGPQTTPTAIIDSLEEDVARMRNEMTALQKSLTAELEARDKISSDIAAEGGRVPPWKTKAEKEIWMDKQKLKKESANETIARIEAQIKETNNHISGYIYKLTEWNEEDQFGTAGADWRGKSTSKGLFNSGKPIFMRDLKRKRKHPPTPKATTEFVSLTKKDNDGNPIKIGLTAKKSSKQPLVDQIYKKHSTSIKRLKRIDATIANFQEDYNKIESLSAEIREIDSTIKKHKTGPTTKEDKDIVKDLLKMRTAVVKEKSAISEKYGHPDVSGPPAHIDPATGLISMNLEKPPGTSLSFINEEMLEQQKQRANTMKNISSYEEMIHFATER
tara:strand:+ start:1133 stop:3094 length:1962 start_codon:yes stop_codon:yes gene_type:complete